jgi:hypothetical protein
MRLLLIFLLLISVQTIAADKVVSRSYWALVSQKERLDTEYADDQATMTPYEFLSASIIDDGETMQIDDPTNGIVYSVSHWEVFTYLKGAMDIVTNTTYTSDEFAAILTALKDRGWYNEVTEGKDFTCELFDSIRPEIYHDDTVEEISLDQIRKIELFANLENTSLAKMKCKDKNLLEYVENAKKESLENFATNKPEALDAKQKIADFYDKGLDFIRKIFRSYSGGSDSDKSNGIKTRKVGVFQIGILPRTQCSANDLAEMLSRAVRNYNTMPTRTALNVEILRECRAFVAITHSRQPIKTSEIDILKPLEMFSASQEFITQEFKY